MKLGNFWTVTFCTLVVLLTAAGNSWWERVRDTNDILTISIEERLVHTFFYVRINCVNNRERKNKDCSEWFWSGWNRSTSSAIERSCMVTAQLLNHLLYGGSYWNIPFLIQNFLCQQRRKERQRLQWVALKWLKWKHNWCFQRPFMVTARVLNHHLAFARRSYVPIETYPFLIRIFCVNKGERKDRDCSEWFWSGWNESTIGVFQRSCMVTARLLNLLAFARRSY